jgi:hypothetical protein
VSCVSHHMQRSISTNFQWMSRKYSIEFNRDLSLCHIACMRGVLPLLNGLLLNGLLLNGLLLNGLWHMPIS